MNTEDPARNARVLLGMAFSGAGIAHVVKHEWFEQLVPDVLSQWRKPISAATAVVQILSGISMFIPRLRAFARWSTVGLLVPTLPAAFDQTRHPERMRELGLNPKTVAARIPAQMLVVALAWWATRPPPIDQR